MGDVLSLLVVSREVSKSLRKPDNYFMDGLPTNGFRFLLNPFLAWAGETSIKYLTGSPGRTSLASLQGQDTTYLP